MNYTVTPEEAVTIVTDKINEVREICALGGYASHVHVTFNYYWGRINVNTRRSNMGDALMFNFIGGDDGFASDDWQVKFARLILPVISAWDISVHHLPNRLWDKILEGDRT